MNLNEIQNFYDVTSTLRLAAVETKTCSAIIANHLAVSKIVKETNADFDEIKQGMLRGLEDQLQELLALRQKYATAKTNVEREELLVKINGCKEVLDVEKKIKDQFEGMLKKEVKIKLDKVEMSQMLAALKEAKPEFTLSDIEKLQIMIK